MRKPAFNLTKRLAVAAAAAIGSALLALAAGQAMAVTNSVGAAGTDAEIRPDFGALIQPPVRHWHPHRPVWTVDPGYGWRGGEGDRYQGVWEDPSWRVDHGYVAEGPVHAIVVDCAEQGEFALNNALNAVEDGGTVFIKPSGKPCVESLVITRPVSIVGEPISAFAAVSDSHPTATIVAPPGMPCLRIGPGVPAVELRDLTFIASQSGASPCIEAWDSRLALTHTHIQYTGDASALFVSGGQLLARESEVHSVSYDPAVVLENSSADIHRLHVTSASTGLDVSLSDGGGLNLDHVDILGVAGPDPSATPEIGLMVHRSHGQPGKIDVRNTRIVGFTTGVWFQHRGVVSVTQTMVAHARVGVLSEGVDLGLFDSSIEARRTGVYVTSGHAEIARNRIMGFTDLPIDTEPAAVVDVHENYIYPADDCGRFYARYSHWCRGFREVPDEFRDHGERRDDDHWGWEGGPFEGPPAPPPEHHGWW